jgi:disulfide bond formation protein DsbB
MNPTLFTCPMTGFKWTADRLWLGLALLGLGLVAGAYVLETYFGAIPCRMCWWQRYAHWAMLGCAGVACLLPFHTVRGYLALGVGLAAAAGLYVAVWQVLAQLGVLAFPASCVGGAAALSNPADLLAAMATVKIVPCDAESFKLFGLTLAMWNVPVMVGALVAGGILLVRRQIS